MEIREVKTKQELKRFIDLPWSIYRDHEQWVPPLKLEIKEMLDPKKHPFYQHGETVKFLAFKDGKVVGRILAADDFRYNQENQTNRGTFGFFESIDDRSVSNALFQAASNWLKNRGRDQMFGPVEYSTNYACGLLLDGFDTPPRVMMPYNPTYYPSLFEDFGFQKNKDLFAWWFDDRINLSDRWASVVERLNQRYNIHVRSFSAQNFQQDLKKCMDVYDNARSSWWWDCVSLTEDEIQFYAKRLSFFADPKQVLLAESDGKTIGFAITVPDWNEIIRPLNGRLTNFGLPIGLLRLFHRFKKVKTARVMVLCVLPDYRKRGVAERLILETLDYGKKVLHYTGAELGWTDETNDKINNILTKVGAQKYKTFRVYDKKI